MAKAPQRSAAGLVHENLSAFIEYRECKGCAILLSKNALFHACQDTLANREAQEVQARSTNNAGSVQKLAEITAGQ